ncbi:hypothetical protein KI387_018612 [Taxus chinensis]|uniref:PARP catalytic domain-containing protein n=1 Tax=Taxus chinensis TaxID=29808 RepID=A0AA38G7Z5_TAXCH|nr:hypothetical protein KI387_018612 [Taxus chinensis]
MDGKIDSWMARNRKIAKNLGLKIDEINTECIKVVVGGYMIQMTIPSGLEDGDSAFAVSLEQEDDEILMETLIALNEKLERVRITSDCLFKVLDSLLEVFEKRKCKKPRKQRQEIEENIDPSVLRLAEDAKVECDKALFAADENSILDEILPWCSVKLIPELEKVELHMELKGIMAQDHVTRALGFCFDHPLIIHINFSSDQWSTREFSVDNFRSVEVFTKQNPVQIMEKKALMDKVVDGLDEIIKNAITKTCSSFKQYGPHDLVPEFVKEFFEECEFGFDGSLYWKEQAAESNNIIVALLISLGKWMKTLKNWCMVCKKELPPFSRLWYCDGELCLYRFEELGIGASVLQELQNSELIDLELTLAAAAATQNSIRDVFEPYPSFLLKKEEPRRRSGFFSSYTYGGDTSSEAENYLSNKNMELLSKLIDSFPPLSEMQQYSNETELVLKLGMSWLKKDGNPGDLSEEEYAEKIRLPYKILRYVLFTNRLSLHLLQKSDRLNVGECLCQFAVFYNSDSEKIFRQRRKTEGSIFAFHGSSSCNWYSIIRNGLRCLSNTNYMSAGNACGDGVYFSTEMRTSLIFSTSSSWTVHGITKRYSVMAICEIFSGKKHSHPRSNFYVVGPKYENDIVIRYLLVFNPCKYYGGGNVRITEDHMLTVAEEAKQSDTNLQQHYEKMRKQYVEEVINGGIFPKDQLMHLLQKRKIITETVA